MPTWKRAVVSGFALAVLTFPATAFADSSSPLAQSNQVTVTGGYMGVTTVQKYQQTGWTSEYVQYQTGGSYYEAVTYQSGTKQQCTSTQVATWHQTYYATFYPWKWNNGHPIDAHYGPPGHYGPPDWYTYQTVTRCQTVPVYSTENVWVPPTYSGRWEQVPTYGWVPVQVQQWVPVTISSK